MYYSVLPDRPMPNQTIYITNPGNTALCNLFNSVLDWVVAIYYEAGSQKYNNLPNTRNGASNSVLDWLYQKRNHMVDRYYTTLCLIL